MHDPVRVGVIGCGNIFSRYATGMSRFPGLELVAVADADSVRAQAAAAGSGAVACTVDGLLDRTDVDVVVNITPPAAHAVVSEQILAAGKHLYVEKPLAATTAAARAALAEADRRGLLFGAAPDTFLGSAGQTARAAVDGGVIGEPVGATAFVTHSQAETWHPDPTFLFRPGGGPALDMGPYYLSALVNCLGPVSAVYGTSRIGAPHRTVTAPGRLVDRIDVSVPTHTAATVTFANGVLATVMLSFDVWDHHLPFIEIYGTEGTLSLPNPNHYDGPVLLRRHGDPQWSELPPAVPPLARPGTDDQLMRGIGVADLAAALREARPHHATASLAFHVLDALEAIAVSADTGAPVHLTTTCERPEPVDGTYGAEALNTLEVHP
ncbi:Gfo/Idh/MocA family oxidoreductase [Streptomyces sp. NPDC001833]|uniref:Gfo/Idh/MocA family protein n=1 Tax=Streptomyces sp. NPDC001833 TaxID=3154658 RepID=UPI003330EC55